MQAYFYDWIWKEDRGKPVMVKSITSNLLSLFTVPSIGTNGGAWRWLVETGGLSSVTSNLEHYVLYIFKQWSEDTFFSYIFSSHLRISKKEGLWFISAAQQLSVKLRKIQEETNQQFHLSKSSTSNCLLSNCININC